MNQRDKAILAEALKRICADVALLATILYLFVEHRLLPPDPRQDLCDQYRQQCNQDTECYRHASPLRGLLIQSHDAPKMHPDGWVWVHRLIVCIVAV